MDHDVDGTQREGLFEVLEDLHAPWMPGVPPLLPEDGGSGALPPIDEPPPRRGGGGGRRARHPDAAVFNPWMTLAAVGVLGLTTLLQMVAIQAGARGGHTAAYALCAAIGVAFLVPFYVGALWLGRQRRAGGGGAP